MEFFVRYLRQRRRFLAAFVLFSLIFLVSFALYGLPLKAVLYPLLLCLLLGLFLALGDMMRVKRRYEMLSQIQSFVDVLSDLLPAADGMEEEAYQNIIRLLGKEHGDFIADSQRKYSEMVDYYTLWAHQIKTPIASMRLTLQNEDTALARQLSNDLFRVEQYVEMVLTFLRLNSDSTDYVIKECDLDEIVKQSVKKFAGEFISRKLRLVYEPVHTSVLTDEKWLAFVVEQVLSNALKYTPSGSITISLELEQVLCIRDTGIGIAAEDLPRIFEKGYTGYNGRADKRASGIGLYLCKRICGNLGHGISAESRPDGGTLIRIDLSRQKRVLE